ncbi:MAG TPA: FMN-binding protein [Vicinamibacterales bacterium]|nr:FMN-binding protein [Vicinamibacterales bacterium]
MKHPIVAALTLVVVAPLVLIAQSVAGFIDPLPTARLKQLFPSAVAFTPRGEKDPVYFTAFGADPARVPGAKPIGWAFWTIDLVPGELGYHGHIHMLVGMNGQGRITGVIVDRNTEPYGDISINLPEFPRQFQGKSIRDKFEVGQDVDVMSRATISVRAAAREIRESSRMVAKAVLRPQDLR